MNSDHYDVVVVGAGLAGLMAAGVTMLAGLKVALISNGPGSFVLSPGWLKACEPDHAGQDGKIRAAVEFFCEMALLADCKFQGDLGGTRALPTVLGEFQEVVLAPESLWNAEPRNESMTAVVGIRGLTDFDENFIAERMSDNARAMGFHCNYAARRVSLEHDLGIPATTAHIASYFDRSAAFCSQLAAALRSVAVGHDRILIPGMLGIRSSGRQLAQFQRELGTSFSELATLPPSIPALRVFHCLERLLQKRGVELRRGYPVEQLNIEHGQCVSLRVEAPGHAAILQGDCVVLAAGHQSAQICGPEFAGIDRAMRPLSQQGAVLAENVLVPQAETGGEFASEANFTKIVSGYRAGRLAATAKGCYAAS
jgi:glycerol-3-phosphate dehydrogenase subunit B